MELGIAVEIAILTGVFTVISGVVFLYLRKWYLYWRQVFLISAMEKQRSGGNHQANEEDQEIPRPGLAYLFALFAICYALVMLAYKTIMNAAAIFVSLIYSMSLRLFIPGA